MVLYGVVCVCVVMFAEGQQHSTQGHRTEWVNRKRGKLCHIWETVPLCVQNMLKWITAEMGLTDVSFKVIRKRETFDQSFFFKSIFTRFFVRQQT